MAILSASRHVFHSWKLWIAVSAAYLLGTVVALWSLVSQFGTASPGGAQTDFAQFLWGFWWIGYSMQHGMSPLWSNYILYPQMSNMAIHTLAAIWYPIYAVTAPVMGQVASQNLMVVLCFLFSGLAMFAWLRRILPANSTSTAIAFIGGLAFTFSPYLMIHADWAQFNLMPIWWFPLILLLWDELAFPRRLPRLITAILLGLACWGLWLTDIEYLVWAPIALIGFVLWTLWATRRKWQWLRLVGWGIVATAIMMALAWFYPLAALLKVNWDPNEFPPAGLKTIRAFSVPLSSLVGLPPDNATLSYGHLLVWLAWALVIVIVLGVVWRKANPHNPGLKTGAESRPMDGATVSRFGPTALAPGRKSSDMRESSNPVGTGPGVSANSTPSQWVWLVLILPPLIFSLGPDIQIGSIDIPLPYLALHILLKGQHRVPSRFTGATFAMLITFMAVAAVPLITNFFNKRRVWLTFATGALSLALFADGGGLAAFPVRFMPDWPIYHQIGQDPRNYVIMDVPIGTQYGWTGIGKGYFFMYYGPIHHHPMIDGWISRIPYSAYAFFLNSPLFSWLAEANNLDAQGRNKAAAEFDKYLNQWPIGYVLLHRDWLTQEEQDEWVGWFNTRPGLCPAEVSPDSNLIWWRAESLGCDLPSPANQIALGTGGDWASIGSGWYQQESIGGPAGRWAQQDASLRVEQTSAEVDLNSDVLERRANGVMQGTDPTGQSGSTVQPVKAVTMWYRLTFTALPFGNDRTVTFSGNKWSSGPIRLIPGDWHTYTVTIPASALKDGLLFLHHNGSASPAALGTSTDPRTLSAAYGTFTFQVVQNNPGKESF